MSLESLAAATVAGLVQIIRDAIKAKDLQLAADATEELARRLGFEELQRSKTPKKKATKKA